EELAKFADTRNSLLQNISKFTKPGYSGTKTDIRNLSPGCRICAEGKWSCLFINGKCNAKCFYCPASQDEIGVPSTNAFSFPEPGAYIDYIEKIGYKGVSISGGEPFLTFEKSLEYIAAVRRKFDSMYIWLYTNGTLVTEDKLKMLHDAGLNEIRFDIGATGYNLKYLKKAIGKIPVVTVEIPAIPEDLEKMKVLMKELSDIGVKHLNIHQLRLTPHNINKLAYKPYTFLPGEKVTVIESEITALKLIHHGLLNNIPLAVNYCSFVYKNRYQGRAARTQAAELVKPGYAEITENGYIRKLFISGNAENLKKQTERLQKQGVQEEHYYLSEKENRLYLQNQLINKIKSTHFQHGVAYEKASLRSYDSPYGTNKEIELNTGNTIYIEQITVACETNISPDLWRIFQNVTPDSFTKDTITDNAFIEKILPYEAIPYGLQRYE
ncbi:MAG: radical SAM protein, partial [Bacteroidota bacterium]